MEKFYVYSWHGSLLWLCQSGSLWISASGKSPLAFLFPSRTKTNSIQFFFQFMYFKNKKAINLLNFFSQKILNKSTTTIFNEISTLTFIATIQDLNWYLCFSRCSYRELHLYYPHGLILCLTISYFEMAYIGQDRRCNTADSRNMQIHFPMIMMITLCYK